MGRATYFQDWNCFIVFATLVLALCSATLLPAFVNTYAVYMTKEHEKGSANILLG